MDSRRRTFLATFVPGVAVIGVGMVAPPVALRAGQSASRPQQQSAVPPASPDHPLIPPAAMPPTTAQLRQNQRDIRKDVDQLFSLAQELKNLADKNDAATELSVNLLQKTEEIEKLAKKIHDLARD
ncbi:MAG TPA: hypothetical protein VKB26_08250 [Candidatus Acidoferrales bacterium]|nr:hypothetical protein [Candidatus Acidoferrales bacterium]